MYISYQNSSRSSVVNVDDPIVLSFDSHLSFLSYISSASELRQEPYVLETTVSGFSKKPIVSMKSCFCLSLSESIAFHKLPNLETVAVITKAKGANAYSWDDRRDFLCFGFLVVSELFRGRGFVEVRDFGVPDTAKSISWCGDNICLAIRKEYVILNTANGTFSEVFPSGRVAPPLVKSLPSGELLLGKNPYAIALFPRRVEVCSLATKRPYPLIQTVVLRHLVKSNNAVIFGLDNSAHVLFPVSIGAQGVNYCDVNICEEILMKSKNYSALLELFKSNSMHHEALKLLKQLLEDSKSNQSKTDVTELFSPELIIEYLKPLCRTDPMLVLEYSMLVLESCPTQTIDLFLSGNISADLVNSYLKQHAPNMQGRYLELMMGMNETAVSGNLQNEMLQIYLSEVLDLHAAQSAQQKWDDKDHPPERKKLLSALESISGYNPQTLLKRLPRDALYEERAVILGKMNQHELALSIYVHKFYAPDLALAYCDRIHESISYLPSGKPSSNIYLTLLQIYLNPKKSAKDFAKRIVALGSFKLGGVFVLMDET
ncbi:unnamed protein product [Brassica rapa]|uniref:Vacuolar sorting protein 39/Transforming growth factor beta receptor-associated domain-containing protein n=2 Tax=Brassica campestris TaxID=3711 RepID=A0A8D9HH11_BRACM|nr:unnamed protein product [Brassica rapa]